MSFCNVSLNGFLEWYNAMSFCNVNLEWACGMGLGGGSPPGIGRVGGVCRIANYEMQSRNTLWPAMNFEKLSRSSLWLAIISGDKLRNAIQKLFVDCNDWWNSMWNGSGGRQPPRKRLGGWGCRITNYDIQSRNILWPAMICEIICGMPSFS